MNIRLFIHTLLLAAIFQTACDSPQDSHDHDHPENSHGHESEEESHETGIHLSRQEFESLGLSTGPIPRKNLSGYVEANGQLEVPPQNEASVTAILGANVMQIHVIEGDRVKKGQVLATLSHPNLIRLQTDYVSSWSQWQYLEQELARQKTLYEEQVGSGKDLQKTEAEYLAAKGAVRGYEAQLRLLGLDPAALQEGEITEQIPVLSPISGNIRFVRILTGQYVDPQTEMFRVVNISHIHADLMVFEKDMHKVEVGQKVTFTLESQPELQLEATIYSVGKAFEEDPKAIHIHAEIDNKQGLLLPGMYVRGRILTTSSETLALPEEGMVREGNQYFIFRGMQEPEGEWAFEPVEVVPGKRDQGWVGFQLLSPLPDSALIAWNKAYYLMADMKKGEAGHHH